MRAIDKWLPLLDRFLVSTQVIVITCRSQLEAKQMRSSFYKARRSIYKYDEFSKYSEILDTRMALLNGKEVIFEYTERRDVRTVLKENLG